MGDNQQINLNLNNIKKAERKPRNQESVNDGGLLLNFDSNTIDNAHNETIKKTKNLISTRRRVNVNNKKEETKPKNNNEREEEISTVSSVNSNIVHLSNNSVPLAVSKFLDAFSEIRETFNTLRFNFNQLRADFTEFNSRLTNFEKLANKTIKTLQKGKKKKMSAIEPKGFNLPKHITPELAEFLKVDPETKITRNDLTRNISKYLKENKLQNPNDGRKFIPNAEFARLLKIPEGIEISYFQMQKHIGHLFRKNDD
jgi:chromatin remodeling complex protein RSC6